MVFSSTISHKYRFKIILLDPFILDLRTRIGPLSQKCKNVLKKFKEEQTSTFNSQKRSNLPETSFIKIHPTKFIRRRERKKIKGTNNMNKLYLKSPIISFRRNL